jgi:Galactose oxidase, central domain/Kelch motif/PKD domain
MRRTHTHLLLALTMALLAGCSPAPSSPSDNMGAAHFAVSTRQALSTDISRIAVTTSAEDLPSATVDLLLENGAWSGSISIPAGHERTFHAQAFDAAGVLRLEGTASDVTIWANETVLVAIGLADVNAPPPFENEAPIIGSLVASSVSVAAGGTISLESTAHDPNPGDSLSYAWSSAEGAFSPAGESATVWTAPASDGIHGLTLTVTDSAGLSSSATLQVTVQGGGRGEVRPSISFNTWPAVSSVTATPSPLAVGQTTSVSASAWDADADTLSYAWSASCEGTWADASSRMAQFTPTAQPSGACNNCTLTVAVTDGQGGRTTGTVALCIGGVTPVIDPSAPYITRAFSSSGTASAGQVLTYEVAARDPQGASLSFSWSANAGTLGTATDSAANSRTAWTAPACVDEDLIPTITATVTNSLNLSSSRSFAVSGVPVCSYAWATTGSMATPRQYFTATLLPNGKVLVVGGRNATYYTSTTLATAELYDPAAGTWSATGSMSTARYHHTATLLANGKVLVTGGYGSSGSLSTAELYDPAAGTWSATGSMFMARYHHTATLLANGKVLVAGTYGSSSPPAAAEMYDPATGAWSPAGSMASGRYQHTATLLANGKVLVAGGYGYYNTIASAEVFDPATGAWSPAGSMATSRYQHTATLLPDGKVLIAGGNNYYSGSLTAADVYDPAAGTWSATGAMVSSRYSHTATLLANGQVLITGGIDAAASVRRSQLYDPASGTWRNRGSVWSSRYGHTTTLLPNGQVLAAGGYGSQSASLATAELYTP